MHLPDRDEIFTHIEADNPRAAASIDEPIVVSARRLVEFPESGRIGRVAGTPYIAAYVVLDDKVRILRVLHGAQIWPEEISTD